MAYTICYVSKSKDSITEQEVEQIFKTTQRNNTENNINGILLHGFGNFFQVLEGSKDQIEPLFSTICDDTRHHRIDVLIRHDVTIPIFASYSSKFNVVKTDSELIAIRTYLEQYTSSDPFSDKINRLIHPFLLP